MGSMGENMHKKYESILYNATSCYFGVHPL